MMNASESPRAMQLNTRRKICQEEKYWIDKLTPLTLFLQANKYDGKLILNGQQREELRQLIRRILGIDVDFHQTGLSVLELLDLTLSLFISVRKTRSQILNTTPGTLRVAGCRLNQKLQANNHAHAVLVCVGKAILRNSWP